MKKSHLMNGSVVGFALSLLLVGTHASAQKVISTTGKNSDPRTTNNPVVITAPPVGVPGTSTVPANDPPVLGNPPTPPFTPPPANVPGPTGVNGTTDVPTNTDNNGPLGGKTQVGGLDNAPKTPGKGGKRVGNATSTLPPAPPVTSNDQSAVPAVVDTANGNQASQTDTVIPAAKEVNQSADKGAGVEGVVTSAAPAPCEDEAIKKINDILLQDTSGVLSNLYELTSRRLALRALAQGTDSLEGLVRKDIKNYKEKIDGMKNSEAIQSQVKAVYETYGKGSDLAKINADFDASYGKAKIACYWTNYRNNQRVWNEEASSYVLSLVVGEKDSGLTDLDAATIWTMEKIRTTALATDPSYAYGKANGNLLNISTRVARYLGKIGGARHANVDEINSELESIQKAVDESVAKAYAQVKTSLYACIDEHNKDCADCAAKAKSEFETKRMSFDKIQRGLLQAVSKSENVKMEKVLKAKMGDVNFDLSDFAVGTVPEDHRKTISKIDACGNRIGGPARTVKKTGAKKGVRKPAQEKKPKTEAASTVKKFLDAKPVKDSIDDAGGLPVKYVEPAKPISPELEGAKQAWEAAHPGEAFPVLDPKKTYLDDVK